MQHDFIFIFIWYFIGAILSENSCQKHATLRKNIKRGDSHIGGLSLEGEFKPSAHYDIERLEEGNLEP